MFRRVCILLPLVAAMAFMLNLLFPARACCPCPPQGKPVLNADQSIIILWDAVNQVEHFIRQASFKSEADDFGFLVPTPAQPELSESGNEAFPFLAKLTAPEIKRVPRPREPATKSDVAKTADAAPPPTVRVLEEKLVAGFKAAVLEASSAGALVAWLKENGYAFSPEIEAWAQPYVEASWKITALKVAKGKNRAQGQDVAAAALRMSFKTDRPLFPYREPDSKAAVETLRPNRRLLRVYFIGEARYKGELTKENPWTGSVAWSNQLRAADSAATLAHLNLPPSTGPAHWWLTEFEDWWPYSKAPADLYFSRDANQNTVKREPIIEYYDAPASTSLDGAPQNTLLYMVILVLSLLALAVLIRQFRASRDKGGSR